MLTYWILGALPYLVSSAVIPNRQISPFEDPPPANEFFLRSSKQEAVKRPLQYGYDTFKEAEVPARFAPSQDYPLINVPFQEYSDTVNGPSDRQLLASESSGIVNTIPVRLRQDQERIYHTYLSSPEQINEEPPRNARLEDSVDVADVFPNGMKMDRPFSNTAPRYFRPTYFDRIDEPSQRTLEGREYQDSVRDYQVINGNDYRLPDEDYRINSQAFPHMGNDILDDRRPVEESPIIIEIIPETLMRERPVPSEEYESTLPQGSKATGTNIYEKRFPIVLDVPKVGIIDEQIIPLRSADNVHIYSDSNGKLSETEPLQNRVPTNVNIVPEEFSDVSKLSNRNDENLPLTQISQDFVPDNGQVPVENYPIENNYRLPNPTNSFQVDSSVISEIPQRNLSTTGNNETPESKEGIGLLEPLPQRQIQKRETLTKEEPGFLLTDTPLYLNKLLRNKRTSSPAVDSVDENPSHWRPQNVPKAQFVTKRGPVEPNSDPLRTYSDRSGANPSTNADIASFRSNEIPVSERERSGYLEEPRRYEYPQYPLRNSDDPYRTREGRLDDYIRQQTPRRIIYYANLPEVVRQGDPRDPYRSTTGTEYGRYDFGRSSSKFPRESRYEDPVVRSPTLGVGRDDRYRDRYRPASTPNSYTIIDAERAPVRSPVRAPYPQRQYPDLDTQSRYNRIPAPYQPSQTAGASYEQFRKPSSVPPRTVGSPAPEPYRDYNPHQPAHWSMQIGTSLTVKDDGRPYNSGRRFYVHSQEQQPYAASRYPRVEDDPRHRL